MARVDCEAAGDTMKASAGVGRASVGAAVGGADMESGSIVGLLVRSGTLESTLDTLNVSVNMYFLLAASYVRWQFLDGSKTQ